MRVMADENVRADVVRLLASRGHDVLSVKESLRGWDDPAILGRAQAEGRTVLTHDKDFGELAFRLGMPAGCGVVLIRMALDDSEGASVRLVEAIESRPDWAGLFAVVGDDFIRVRPLPAPRR